MIWDLSTVSYMIWNLSSYVSRSTSKRPLLEVARIAATVRHAHYCLICYSHRPSSAIPWSLARQLYTCLVLDM